MAATPSFPRIVHRAASPVKTPASALPRSRLTSSLAERRTRQMQMEPVRLSHMPVEDMVYQVDCDYFDPLGYWTLFGPKTRAGTGSQSAACGANSAPASVDYLSAIRRHFLDAANERSVLGFPQFLESCQALGITNQEFIRRLFQDFDADASGVIEPDEICNSLEQFLRGEDRTQVFRGCFNVYDADGSGVLTALELEMQRGDRTNAMLGITPEQRDCLSTLFRRSPYLTNRDSMDFKAFVHLITHEPSLIKSMFSIVMAYYAKKLGISLDLKKAQQ